MGEGDFVTCLKQKGMARMLTPMMLLARVIMDLNVMVLLAFIEQRAAISSRQPGLLPTLLLVAALTLILWDEPLRGCEQEEEPAASKGSPSPESESGSPTSKGKSRSSSSRSAPPRRTFLDMVTVTREEEHQGADKEQDLTTLTKQSKAQPTSQQCQIIWLAG